MNTNCDILRTETGKPEFSATCGEKLCLECIIQTLSTKNIYN
jgi:hypothetical protein